MGEPEQRHGPLPRSSGSTRTVGSVAEELAAAQGSSQVCCCGARHAWPACWFPPKRLLLMSAALMCPGGRPGQPGGHLPCGSPGPRAHVPANKRRGCGGGLPDARQAGGGTVQLLREGRACSPALLPTTVKPEQCCHPWLFNALQTRILLWTLYNPTSSRCAC